MIIANIKDAERYFSINKNFENAFEFLKTLNEESKKGHFEYDGFNGNILEFDSFSEKSEILEAHKEYLDIHYVLDGSEAIGYADIDCLTVDKEYDRNDDYMLLRGNMYEVYLNKGDFCIVFPEDAHAPIKKAYHDSLKKVVVKIKL